MSKPIVKMAIEVLEARAVNDFISRVNIKVLTTDELNKLLDTLENKRTEIRKELYFERREGAGKNGNETEHPLNPKL